MDNTVETTPRTPATTRRLRSLHLPSSSSSSSSATNEISRRFNSLRRPHNNTNTQSPLAQNNLITPPIPSPPIPSPPLPSSNHSNNNTENNLLESIPAAATTTITDTTAATTTTPAVDIPQKVHIKLVPNVGMTNRCFVFDVVDRELESGGPALKLGRYSDRTVVTDRISFKSKVTGLIALLMQQRVNLIVHP